MKHVRKCALLIGTFILLHSTIQAQDSIRTGKWITLDLHYGFIMPLYNSSMNILVQGHVPAMEADYVYKPICQNNWLGIYRCPELGIAVFSAYLNNPAQLGNEYGLYPFVNFHLNRNYKERLYLRVGLGIGYLPVKFNPYTNHKNDVIGSHINAMFNMRLNYHLYLSNKLRLETGLGLTHCSNGNYQTPNLGINLITTNLGLSYGISGISKCAAKTAVDTLPIKKTENDFMAAGGISETEVSGRKKFPAVTLSYLRYYRLSRKGKLGFGTDIFNNQANTAKLNADGIYPNNYFQITQVGLKASYEVVLGRLSFPLEMGGYVYSTFKGDGSTYNRVGVRYYFGKHLITYLTLLTHFVEADYAEWGVGYSL
jgi:hypothetical protein